MIIVSWIHFFCRAVRPGRASHCSGGCDHRYPPSIGGTMATSEREHMRQQTDDATSIHPLFPWICWVLIALLMTACGRKTAPSIAGGDEHRIVVAVIYSAPPALFRDSGGHVNGFMYDIEVELSRRLQMPFMYQPTSFENIITGIQSGKFDIG